MGAKLFGITRVKERMTQLSISSYKEDDFMVSTCQWKVSSNGHRAAKPNHPSVELLKLEQTGVKSGVGTGSEQTPAVRWQKLAAVKLFLLHVKDRKSRRSPIVAHPPSLPRGKWVGLIGKILSTNWMTLLLMRKMLAHFYCPKWQWFESLAVATSFPSIHHQRLLQMHGR